MSYEIKTYKPDSGFDEAQAEIYNFIANKYGTQTVKPEDLKTRTEKDKFDQDGMRFAYTSDGKPMAYIRYHKYGAGNVYIGYPWSKEDFPEDEKDKMFDDLLAYVKEKNPDKKELFMGYIDERLHPAHDFAKRRNFDLADNLMKYELDCMELNKNELDSYTYKEATESDLETLVELALTDPDLKGMGKENLTNYFKDKVLKDGNAVILFDNKEPVSATAVLKNFEEGKSLFRFSAIKNGESKYFKYTHTSLIKLLDSKGINNQNFIIYLTDESEEEMNFMKKVNAKELNRQIRYRIKI